MSFPYNTKTIIQSVPASGGIDCPILLPAVNAPYSLLSAYISNSGDDLATLSVGSEVILSTLQQRGIFQSNFNYPFLNKSITCSRANNKPFQFIINYVEYDIMTTPPVTATVQIDPALSTLLYLGISLLVFLGFVSLIYNFFKK